MTHHCLYVGWKEISTAGGRKRKRERKTGDTEVPIAEMKVKQEEKSGERDVFAKEKRTERTKWL